MHLVTSTAKRRLSQSWMRFVCACSCVSVSFCSSQGVTRCPGLAPLARARARVCRCNHLHRVSFLKSHSARSASRQKPERSNTIACGLLRHGACACERASACLCVILTPQLRRSSTRTSISPPLCLRCSGRLPPSPARALVTQRCAPALHRFPPTSHAARSQPSDIAAPPVIRKLQLQSASLAAATASVLGRDMRDAGVGAAAGDRRPRSVALSTRCAQLFSACRSCNTTSAQKRTAHDTTARCSVEADAEAR